MRAIMGVMKVIREIDNGYNKIDNGQYDGYNG